MYRSVVLGEVGNELWIIVKACFELKTRRSKCEVPKRQCLSWEDTVHLRSLYHMFYGLECGVRVCQEWWRMWGNARGWKRLEGDKTSFILQEVVLGSDLPSKSSLILKCNSWSTSGQSYGVRLGTALSLTSSTCLFSSRDTSWITE